MIDAILFDALKWDRNFVETEPYVRDEGYADYIFYTKVGGALVLEAKRVGTAFVLPSGDPYPPRAVPFSLIADRCPAAHKAAQQAISYSNGVGARFTAISNGLQWLLMMTSVENTLLRDRNVMVFESLEAIRDKFALFWKCFAPLMIQVNKPYALLLDTRRQPAPAKLSTTVAQYPVIRDGADVRNDHAIGIQYIWDEINNNEGSKTFFEECYVPPLGHEKNRNLATQLLSDRSSEDLAAFETISAADAGDLFKGSPRPERPVILLGRIGRGKSTFIKYLKTVAAPSTLEHYVQIDIDFLDMPRTKDEVAEYVYGTVSEQLRDHYDIDTAEDGVVRAALSGPLLAFRKTPRAKFYIDGGQEDKYREAELEFIEAECRNAHSYLKRVVQHLKGGRRKSVVMFFDNLDKRAELQEEAFLIASAIARDWATVVFICLRPGTFRRSRDLGVLDSIAPRLIEVHSPPVALFLKRRLGYSSAIAEGIKPPPRQNEALSKTVAEQAQDLAGLFDALSNSVQRDRALCGLFEAVANGNLRDVLFRVGSVMTSWQLNTGEITAAIRRSGSYDLTHHQALRAMLYGNSVYFDPKRCPLVNLFDIVFADPCEHFVRPIVLYHLADVPHEGARQGFIAYEELMAKGGVYNFTPDMADAAIRLLFAKRLVEDDNFSETWPGTDSRLRLSLLGRYHISELMNRFEYLDAVVIDTPIIDTEAAREVRVVEAIGDRLKRGRVFLRYLNECAAHVEGTPFYSHWERVHSRAASEITDIEQRANAMSSD